MTVLAIQCVLAVLSPGSTRAAPAGETDIQRALRDTERLSNDQQTARGAANDRAARASTEVLRLAHERAVAAARLQLAETATADIAARMQALGQRSKEAEQNVRLRTNAIETLLPLIERLSLYPAETLLAVPAPPEAALRGVLVLQGLSRQIEQETAALRQDQATLDAATEALRQEAPRLNEARMAQKRETDALDQAIALAHAEQATAEAESRQAASRAEAAASHMDTLRSALVVLESQRRIDEAKARDAASHAEQQKRSVEAQAARQREAVAARSSGTGTIAANASPRGQLQPPVIGVVVKRWGEQTDAGPATGMSYFAPSGARVISPCGGRVVFAQTFRSYGLLLILDCGGGYHVVLSGFDRVDVKLGQRLVAGEPLGVMPKWEPGAATPRPALYVELRHDGTAVDPAPWLRSSS